MKSKIISQIKNPFLNREEIVLEIESESSPTKEDIKKEIGKEEDLVVVKKVGGGFGKHHFVADVVVYESQKDKERVEVIPKKIRKKLEEEAKKKAEEEAKKKAEEEKAKEEAEKGEKDEKKTEGTGEEKEESKDVAEDKDGN